MSRSRSKNPRDWEHPSLSEARRLLTARKGPATEADAPRASTFPGPREVRLPGQLALDDELGHGLELGEHRDGVDDLGDEPDDDDLVELERRDDAA
jgi:hypothetical protein